MQPVHTTREELLHALKKQGPQTAADLSQSLQISATAVRQHLDRLQAEGWVELAGLRRGNGRPGHIYALTSQADRLFSQQYDRLALDLLNALEHLPNGSELLRDVLAARRQLLHERSGPRLAGRVLQEQIAIISEIMGERGNLAEHVRQPDGSHLLIEHHCSIGQVAARYPLLCEEEQMWLQESLQVRVERLRSRAGGDPTCTFRVIPGTGKSTGRRALSAEQGG